MSDIILAEAVSAARTANMIPGWLSHPIDRSLEKFIINNHFMSEKLQRAIMNGEIIETMAGAASVTFNVEDADRTLIQDELLQDWCNMNPPTYTVVNGKRKTESVPAQWNQIYGQLDGRDLALAGVTKSGNEFDLTFENRAVNDLRRFKSHKIWYRGQFTRAEVIQATTKEVQAYTIPFYCPELTKVQPITKATLAPSTSTSTKTLQPGFGTSATTGAVGFSSNAGITVKGVPATAQQLSYISRVLATGKSMGANFNVEVSSIMCITQESDISLAYTTDPNTGIGLFSQIPADGWPATGTDVEADAAAYFKVAIANESSNPGIGLADLVQSVQNSGAGASYYAQWQTEATHTVQQWGGVAGGTGATSPGVLTTTTTTSQEFNKYAFERGQNGTAEDSWTFDQRLASEVQWYLFMVDNTLYYVQEKDIMAQSPLDIISEATPGITQIDYDIDTGKTVSTCTVECDVDRWQCPPGALVIVEDCGPANGTWMVYENHYPLFGTQCEITLQLPTPPLDEPSPSVSTSTSTGTSLSSLGLSSSVAAGTGVTNPIKGWTRERDDMGVDANAPSGAPYYAPAGADYVAPPIGGWLPYLYLFRFNPPLSGTPFNCQYFYVAEGINMISLSDGQHVSAGQVIGTSNANSIETGWGSPTSDQRTLAGQEGDSGAASPPAGSTTQWGETFATYFGIQPIGSS